MYKPLSIFSAQRSKYHVYFRKLLEKYNQAYNFHNGLIYMRVYNNQLIEISPTHESEYVNYLVNMKHDKNCPSRMIDNYKCIPRQLIWNSLKQIDIGYSQVMNLLEAQFSKSILSTSYYNLDGSVSSFWHVLDNTLLGYSYIGSRSYVLSLKAIEKELFLNTNLIIDSTYKIDEVTPVPLNSPKIDNSLTKFTGLEKSIIDLLYQGETSAKSIAILLQCSYRTIEEYLDNIKRKLSAKSKYDLIFKINELYLHIS